MENKKNNEHSSILGFLNFENNSECDTFLNTHETKSASIFISDEYSFTSHKERLRNKIVKIKVLLFIAFFFEIIFLVFLIGINPVTVSLRSHLKITIATIGIIMISMENEPTVFYSHILIILLMIFDIIINCQPKLFLFYYAIQNFVNYILFIILIITKNELKKFEN